MSQEEYIFPRIVYQYREPTEFDDITHGYVVGQPWVNLDRADEDREQYWVCVNETENNAIWKNISEGVIIVDNHYDENIIDYFNKIVYCRLTKQVYYADIDLWILLSYNIIEVETYDDLPNLEEPEWHSQLYHKRLGWTRDTRTMYYCTGDRWVPLTISYRTGMAKFPGCYGATIVTHNFGIEPGFVQITPLGRAGDVWVEDINDIDFTVCNNSNYHGMFYWFCCGRRNPSGYNPISPPPSIKKPTLFVSCCSDGSTVPETPFLKTSPFQVENGIDTHYSTDWQIKQDSTVVWESLDDLANLTEIEVPSEILEEEEEYEFMVRHRGVNVGLSPWQSKLCTTAPNWW